jgi:5-methylcytosine-specific restriction enzyme A
LEDENMPYKSKHPCKCRGCNKLAEPSHGYCPNHKEIEDKEHKDNHKLYKSHRDDKYIQAFYKSKEWERARKARLIMDNGLCQDCLRQGKITIATIVHHIVPAKVNWLLRLVLSNLMSLCDACHNKAHGKKD